MAIVPRVPEELRLCSRRQTSELLTPWTSFKSRRDRPLADLSITQMLSQLVAASVATIAHSVRRRVASHDRCLSNAADRSTADVGLIARKIARSVPGPTL